VASSHNGTNGSEAMIINQTARETIPSQNSVYVKGQFP
jgi:hypothetical protein